MLAVRRSLSMACSLNNASVHRVIDTACEEYTKKCAEWTFTRAIQKDLQSAAAHSLVDELLLYGVLATSVADQKKSLTSFYFGYSTWNGPVIFLDKLGEDFPTSPNTEVSGLTLALYQLLCNITVSLDCARLTWQDYLSHHPKFAHSVQPEFMEGWLTVKWKEADFRDYAVKNKATLLEPVEANDFATIRDCFKQCAKAQSHPNFDIQFATEDQCVDIRRLVQGLAEYEREPDAVVVTADDYRRDGFGERPIFHCLVLRERESNRICGMALCYVGYSLDDGMFLYLEDLFIEDSCRGKGAGKLVMSTLAAIGCCVRSSRIFWQVLDWNTPAIQFYDSIGAKVVPDFWSRRFAGQQLKEFAAY